MSEEPEKIGLPEPGSPYPGPVEDGDDYDLAASAEPRPNRITVVETVYHQVGNDKPMSVESRFERILASDEQVYERRHKNSQAATTEWKKLDYGWVPSVGMIVIRNDDKINTLLAAYSDGTSGYFRIPPGEPFRCCPSGILSVMATEGTIDFTIFVFPR